MTKAILAAVLGVATTVVAGEPQIEMYQTCEGEQFRQLDTFIPFSKHRAVSVPVLNLDAAKPSHVWKGLGVSFSEAGCKILSELLAEDREKVLRMVFARKGAGLTMGRIHVGCSDYSAHVYTYDDVEDDFELKHFSIDEDRKYVLPIIKEAQRINPDIFFFGSVWTPPAWMKLGRELCGGWIDAARLPVFCDYYVKFLQAYAKEGVKVSAISAQNEPCSDQDGESPECKWGPNEEMAFLAKLMPPRLKAAGLDTQLWMHDCEPHEWRQVVSELDDPEVRKNTAAIAWHSYGADPTAYLAEVRKRYPNVTMYHTEMGPHLDGTRTITWWGKKFTPFVNGGCSALTSWCMVLNSKGLPNTSRGFNCAGFIEVDPFNLPLGKVGAHIKPSAQWDFFRHIGPYVDAGAQVLATGYADLIPCHTAIPMSERFVMVFRNPDGAYVIVATNTHEGMDRKLQLQVKLDGKYTWFQLPSKSVSTIIIRN